MALEAGLDLAIINPNISSMTDTVRAFRVLGGFDVNSAEYIAAKAEPVAEEKPKAGSISLASAIEGGLKKVEASVDSSNVMVVCPACEKATRIKMEVRNDKKVRVCKKCNESLDV